MTQLNSQEVNSIREAVSGHKTISAKLGDYAERCQDPQIKQMFQKASTDAGNGANKLLQML